ncbi:ATP-binding cassette sub-family C member 9-like [Saccoglossus kowalevskii]
MNNVSSRYADNVDPVLRNINIHLKSGQKIAVCGLTGSGKSSLILTLLRIIDIIEGKYRLYGSVIIDGIDISKVSIWTLRNRISIIPQYPVLFTGTIRFNLDPEGRHTNQELWRSLEIVELEDMVRNIDGQLDAIVTEGGLNFGAGQRKLFHLARTFLRKSNILVIDEAAASSDIQTVRYFFSKSFVRMGFCNYIQCEILRQIKK